MTIGFELVSLHISDAFQFLVDDDGNFRFLDRPYDYLGDGSIDGYPYQTKFESTKEKWMARRTLRRRDSAKMMSSKFMAGIRCIVVKKT